MEEIIYNKTLQLLKEHNIVLLFDDNFPIEEKGKYVRIHNQKFIILKERLKPTFLKTFSLHHELSHAIHDDDLHIFNEIQQSHKEFLANCQAITEIIYLKACEEGAPTKDISALMEYVGVTGDEYYPVYKKIISRYYDSEGNPLSRWDF